MPHPCTTCERDAKAVRENSPYRYIAYDCDGKIPCRECRKRDAELKKCSQAAANQPKEKK